MLLPSDDTVVAGVMKVYDGVNATAPLVAQYLPSSATFQRVTSSGGALFLSVLFTYGGSYLFAASIKSVGSSNQLCSPASTPVVHSEGNISLTTHDPGTACSWLFVADEGKAARVTFSFIDMAFFDNLNVYDGSDTSGVLVCADRPWSMHLRNAFLLVHTH